ncbi:hypothetical protein [Deminuibacter soli]|uniref:Tetratricopeptide repeat protein n=1 Tax=Deminuibacter soli TaxID=2291815 RepID=A0A3E1NPF9_9BACT|nr:hypothetical protein [Deminuibacter soli]RFM29812.1 hypothetical protein DXN05_02210 [Deminuibacter soli]
MKKVLVAFSILLSFAASAQTDKFAAAMQKNLDALEAAKTPADLQGVSASFERIAEAEKTQWLPYYYAALAQERIGFSDKDADKDKIGDKANQLLDKAEAIEKNAELYCLRNMAATIQMLVDPQSRWQTYGQQAQAALQSGMQLEPNNPRLYYLQGMSVFGTPEAFGGGKEKAKPIFQKAVDLYASFTPKPMYPNWGSKEAADMLAKCE